MTTLITNVRFAGESSADSWILVDGDTIASTGRGPVPDADTVVDGKGMLAMPGAIDCHVHMRQPGMTEKADIRSESRAAIAGGVTSYLEMPNTKPPTTTIELWQQKCDIAERDSAANYGFFIGATDDNIGQLLAADYTRVPGVKLFMGSSTGNMLVDDDKMLDEIFGKVDSIIAVHAEDQAIIDKYTRMMTETADGSVPDDLPVEMHSHIRSVSACYNSSKKAVDLARKHGTRLHICHISTEAELSLLSPGDPSTKLITSEVSPHHLMWSIDDYKRKGALIKMNPAVKDDSDREALVQAVESGLIDIVATDHAPHLLSQKQGGALKAVSGAPLVQFALPWMLDRFSETTVQRVMCENPAKVYRIDRRGRLAAGFYADIVLVSENAHMVTGDTVISKCGWSPMEGTMLCHRIERVWINGTEAYAHGTVIDHHASMPLHFDI